jgi:glutathione peroxidase
VRRALALLGLVALLALSLLSQTPPKKGPVSVDKGIYDFWLNDIDGKPVQLSTYKGEVLLLVNTASECGYTPQYKGLEELYQAYKAKGFRVLAFPSNDFGAQEPGTNAQIHAFCTTKYHTTFPLFAKIKTTGAGLHPLYAYLTRESATPGEVEWNFQKYLVDRNGKVVERFLTKVEPMAKEVRAAVERELAKKPN